MFDSMSVSKCLCLFAFLPKFEVSTPEPELIRGFQNSPYLMIQVFLWDVITLRI